jgi:hypothetical protein
MQMSTRLPTILAAFASVLLALAWAQNGKLVFTSKQDGNNEMLDVCLRPLPRRACESRRASLPHRGRARFRAAC